MPAPRGFLHADSGAEGGPRGPGAGDGVPQLRSGAPRAGTVPAGDGRSAERDPARPAPHGVEAPELRGAAGSPPGAESDGGTGRGHDRAQRDAQRVFPGPRWQPRGAVLRHGGERLRDHAHARPQARAPEPRVTATRRARPRCPSPGEPPSDRRNLVERQHRAGDLPRLHRPERVVDVVEPPPATYYLVRQDSSMAVEIEVERDVDAEAVGAHPG